MRADCPRRRRHRRGRVRGVPRPESPPRFQPFASPHATADFSLLLHHYAAPEGCPACAPTADGVAGHRRGRVRGVPRPESPRRFQPFARRLKFPLMAWRHAGDEFLGHLTGSHRPRLRHCAVCGSNVTTNHWAPSPTRFNFRFSIRQLHKRSAQLPMDESTPCGSAGAGRQLLRLPFFACN